MTARSAPAWAASRQRCADWRILVAVRHSNGASRQRGSVALYFLFSLVASVAIGYLVYVVIRDRRQAVADDAIAAPAPPRPRAQPMEPPPPPVEEARPPDLIEPDAAERAAVAPELVDSDRDAVLFGSPGVLGGLEPGQVERTIKRYMVRYERCMRRAKERGVPPRGELRLTFVIDAEGSVDYATAKPTGIDEELAVCVVEVVQKLRFDKPSDGMKAKVVYPIGFVTAQPGASSDPMETR